MQNEGEDHPAPSRDRGRATGYEEQQLLPLREHDVFTAADELKRALVGDAWSVDAFVIPPGGDLAPGATLRAVRGHQAALVEFEASVKQVDVRVTTCLRGIDRFARGQGRPVRLPPPYDQQPVVTGRCHR